MEKTSKRENKEASKLGINLTGIEMSPKDAEQMIQGAKELTNPPPGSDEDVAMNRIRYMKESDPLGSVPVPGTLKGAVKSGAQMVQGNRPQALIDKLAERLAFERSGTRLYDALISKHQAFADSPGMPPIEMLRRFRDQEHAHFLMLADVLRSIGADPTAVTPCADVMGVAAMGLMQVITDPRTTFSQSLEAILTAELTDNASWDLLIRLVESAGLDKYVADFRKAHQTEMLHLSETRSWLEKLALLESSMGPTTKAA